MDKKINLIISSSVYIAGSLFLALTTFVYYVFSAPPDSPYNPGETLSPTCVPGDANCTVIDLQPANDYLTDITNINPSQGDIIYYNGSDWVNLSAGVNGQYLKTQGAGANPIWSDLANSSIVDADSDTKILTEQAVDEDYIRFYTGGTQRMLIDNNGNIGIGTSSPTSKLQVNGQVRATSFSVSGDGTKLAPVYSFTNNTDLGIFASNTAQFPTEQLLAFSVEGEETMTLSTSTMYLGVTKDFSGDNDIFTIKTVKPDTSMLFSTSGDVGTFFRNGNGDNVLTINSTADLPSEANVEIRGTGNGNTTYDIFSVQGHDGSKIFSISENSDNNYSYMYFYNGDTSKMLLGADGQYNDVLIGGQQPTNAINHDDTLFVYSEEGWSGMTVAQSSVNGFADGGAGISLVKGRGVTGDTIGSAQVNDWSGAVQYKIINNVGSPVEIAAIRAKATNVTSGSETGELHFFVRDGANWEDVVKINKVGIMVNTSTPYNDETALTVVGDLAVTSDGGYTKIWANDNETVGIDMSAPDINVHNRITTKDNALTGLLIETLSNSPIVFTTNGTNERMRITADGKVGIGTATPGELLDVHGAIHIEPGSAPAVANEGDLYYDDVDNVLKCYDGANWQNLW